MADITEPSVRRSVILPASREDVWRAITDADLLSRWFGAEVELEAEPGGLVSFRDPAGRVRRATVDRVEDRRLVGLRWWPAAGRAGRVDLMLDDHPEGTRLTVTETASQQRPPKMLDSGGMHPFGNILRAEASELAGSAR